MVENLKLPKDLVMGVPILTMTGKEEAFIENYKGILECSSETVMVQTKVCRIRIVGHKLTVDYYTNDEMKITGQICQIVYL
ncbi:MAG: sporulation protein [Lachnospiraceae bacterium]|nr:sporulation protein [Lachnospiraceae bacterium]